MHSPSVSGSTFEAANEMRRDIMLWRAEENALEQDLKDKKRIEARVYDLYRNNDYFRGLIEKKVDTLVGSKVILQCKPDFEALGAETKDARAWCKTVERKFHAYADSPENWITADRSMNFTQMMRAAARSFEFTGEITATREWRKSPLKFSTCFNLFSPDRMKNPTDPGKKDIFHGIEFDSYGAAVAYHIDSPIRTKADRAAKSYSKYTGQNQVKRYGRYTRFGWPQVFHIYEPFKPEYPRGISRAACVIKKIKQLDRYHQADLDKAIIATSYVFVITSDETPESVADMLSGADMASSNQFAIDAGGTCLPPEVAAKKQEILDDICDRYVKLTGGQIMHAFKGEEVKTVAAPNTIQTSSEFSKGHARYIANGLGMSYELGSGDFDGVSFSGGMMSLGIYEHAANNQRTLYIHKFASLCFRSWLDEAIDKGEVPLLNGADYWANKEAYSRCEFSGARRVHVDPVKNARATSINLANGTASRTDVVNAEGGDIENIIKNRAVEADMIAQAVKDVAKERGLELTPEIELSLIIDVLTAKEVTPPEVVGDPVESNNE